MAKNVAVKKALAKKAAVKKAVARKPRKKATKVPEAVEPAAQ
jgi:hypothetical protein